MIFYSNDFEEQFPQFAAVFVLRCGVRQEECVIPLKSRVYTAAGTGWPRDGRGMAAGWPRGGCRVVAR